MDMVLSPLVDACIGKVADLTGEKVGMIMGVKDELMRLQRRLLRLSYFLEDAEKKVIRDTSIRNWLGELKDVVYDAEDILDLCRVHPTNLLEENLDQQPPSVRSSSRSPCFPLISCFTCAKFRHEIAEEIKKLNDRLLEIEHDSSVLSKLNTSSIIRPAGQSVVGREVDHRRQTTSLLAKSEVIGQQMEEATKLLVEWLTNEDNKRKCSVFGVVGMGGIGKTTLARKVYNHASINQHFPTRIWVCVSQTYSDTELLKQIIREAGGSYREANTKSELTPILASALSKNFFLVLDDIWSADVWENLLQEPLECAAASGRVLVTTRKEDKVKRMLAKKVYNVQKMNNNDGWVLLCKKVFGDYNEEVERLGLKDIGIQIVNKCDGLPLAINVIGGVLRTKDHTRRSEWGKILGSNVWLMDVQEELRGALYLSYEDLPAHLKQCFLYCSLYPEDARIRRGDLIRYWVAEGFIRSADEGDAGILMEDIADDYCMELVRRSLLQAHDDYFCYMHDMLRSLAQFLIGGESVCLAGPDATTTLNANSTALQKLRRLSLVIKEEEEVMPATFNTMRREHLRTLLCFPYIVYGRNNDQQLAENNSLFDVLGRHLRVLNLNRMNIESLPDSLGNLVHLRHLGLDNTRIRRLPDSIQNLVNLQNLSLLGCDNLHTLPKGITHLYNLRYLNIEDTPLIRMPKGLGRMKQLNHLEGYSAGDHETVEGQSEGCNMDELRNLSQMRRLGIINLERATTGTPTITNKPFLKEIRLEYNQTAEYGEADIQRMEKVLEELFPPPSIQVLEVHYYPGRGYPSWISTPSSSSLITSSSFPLLETIILYDCKYCTQLPPLGQLPQLKFLKIVGADAVVNVRPEFAWGGHAGSVQCAFPGLETLQFFNMYSWKEWTLLSAAGVGGGDDDDDEIRSGGGLEATKLLLPRLKELQLINCRKLRSLPAGLTHANSLESMALNRLHKIIEVNQLPWLTDLVINGCRSLERISHLPRLQRLKITYCPKLKDVVHLDALCSLKLIIGRKEQYLPAWLVELAATHHRQRSEEAHSSTALLPVPAEINFQLQLTCGSALFRKCVEVGGEYWPIIQQFPEVAINAKNSYESLAYTRTPHTYKANLDDFGESDLDDYRYH